MDNLAYIDDELNSIQNWTNINNRLHKAIETVKYNNRI